MITGFRPSLSTKQNLGEVKCGKTLLHWSVSHMDQCGWTDGICALHLILSFV